MHRFLGLVVKVSAWRAADVGLIPALALVGFLLVACLLA